MRRLGRTALGASLLGIAGCALATATPPAVEVAQVELRGVGVFEQALAVTLCVTNPNDSELAFRRVRVSVDVGGAPLASSESESAVRLPPRSSTLVPFAVMTTVRNLGPQVVGILRTGRVEYNLRGSIQLAGALAITLPFSRSGRLDLLSAGDQLADAAARDGTRCRGGAATQL